MKKYLTLLCLCMFFMANAQEQFSVYFNTDQYQLSVKEKSKLKDWIKHNQDVKIVAINGYTDEDGSVGYNDTLAKNRVEEVYKIVSTQVKIREDFKTRSFGKLHNQSLDKAQNRRVTIYFILNKDLDKEDEILGIKTNEIIPKPKPKVDFPKGITLTNPNGTESHFDFDIEFMQSIHIAQPGEKLQLKNINFVLNTFAVENDSRGKLYELLTVMQINLDLKIEIQGHICCNKNPKEKLSTERAKAIKNFLVMQGVDGSRITYKGFGSTNPIYPLPEQNEEERAANRRVEILIVEN